MGDLIELARRYLQEALGVHAEIVRWVEESRLPLFLRERYALFRGRVLNCSCFFMVDESELGQSPALVLKHRDVVVAAEHMPVVYVCRYITGYARKRLLEHRIPFLVPGSQMFLPFLGVELRECFSRPDAFHDALSPSAQVLLLHALLEDAGGRTPTALARKLGYSAMAMSRAFDELVAAELVTPTTSGRGRERYSKLSGSKREVWSKAQPRLRTPVLAHHAVPAPDGIDLAWPMAGASALAQISMLAEPRNLTLAVSRRDWKALLLKGVPKIPADESDAVTIELWRYDPDLLAESGRVDRLSLYLSLRGTDDERIQAAMSEMMEGLPW